MESTSQRSSSIRFCRSSESLLPLQSIPLSSEDYHPGSDLCRHRSRYSDRNAGEFSSFLLISFLSADVSVRPFRIFSSFPPSFLIQNPHQKLSSRKPPAYPVISNPNFTLSNLSEHSSLFSTKVLPTRFSCSMPFSTLSSLN